MFYYLAKMLITDKANFPSEIFFKLSKGYRPIAISVMIYKQSPLLTHIISHPATLFYTVSINKQESRNTY